MNPLVQRARFRCDACGESSFANSSAAPALVLDPDLAHLLEGEGIPIDPVLAPASVNTERIRAASRVLRFESPDDSSDGDEWFEAAKEHRVPLVTLMRDAKKPLISEIVKQIERELRERDVLCPECYGWMTFDSILPEKS